MTALRTHYEPHLGRWLIDSPVVLNAAQVERIRLHTLMIQTQRHAGMSPGDKREEVGRSIKALEANKIVRRPIPKTLESEATVFASTPGTGKIYVGA